MCVESNIVNLVHNELLEYTEYDFIVSKFIQLDGISITRGNLGCRDDGKQVPSNSGNVGLWLSAYTTTPRFLTFPAVITRFVL